METKGITKAPHYFLVHFNEIATSVNGCNNTGKPYTIFCDGFATHVYGFRSEAEANEFDPLKLRSMMRASQDVKILWNAPDEETLMNEIVSDQRVIDGVYTLNHRRVLGAIENLPECQRMYKDADESLLCGKPQNEYGDGCYGGCVIQGNDQEEEFHDGFRCPIHEYWNKRFSKVETEG